MSNAQEKEETTEEINAEAEIARHRDVWTFLVALRTINALTLATFFVPDEYYQVLEPAWALAFGEGSQAGSSYINGPWIAWEWKYQLRSSIFPVFMAGVYKTIDYFINWVGLPPKTYAKLIVLLPKAILGGMGAMIDYYTWNFAERIYGHKSMEGFATICMMVISPWQWVVSTRSLTNCVETMFTVWALYLWPWQWLKTSTGHPSRRAEDHKIKYCVMLAGLAFFIRPSNIIIWATLTALMIGYSTGSEILLIVRNGLIWGPLVFLVSTIADTVYYGNPVFPALNWTIFNFSLDMGSFYGTNPVYYYFVEGIPVLMAAATPFAAIGLIQALTGDLSANSDGITSKVAPGLLRTLGIVTLSLPLALTLVSHKEARFIYPVLPILAVLSARPVVRFFRPFPSPSSGLRRTILYFIVLLHVAGCLYFGFNHNRGVIDVMDYLKGQYEEANKFLTDGHEDYSDPIFPGFMMPCHSVPWRSHMVYNDIRAWGLFCDPPFDKEGNLLEGEELEEYVDESDKFYEDPQTWMRMEFATQRRIWPQYLVFFESLKPVLEEVIVTEDIYHECWRGFNSLFSFDDRRQGDVIVWCKSMDSFKSGAPPEAGGGLKKVRKLMGGMMGHGGIAGKEREA